jgi:23S rRNA (uracil1939-C5)-methyltransferase
MIRAGTTIEVVIDRIIPGGDGLGHHEGVTVFVPMSAPGDELVVNIVESRPDYLRGDIVRILKPGPGRVEPACPYYGQCGGCNLMHLSYEAQLEAKLGVVREAWRRAGGLEPCALDIEASVPFGYRNRAQFHFDSGKSVGYARRATSRIMSVRSCPILVPALERWLGSAGPADAWKSLSAYMAGKDRFVAFGYGDTAYIEGRDGEVSVDVAGRGLRFNIQGFFQSNLGMVERLLPWVCADVGGARAADLYCGVGLFATFLKDSFARMMCVEQDQRSVAYACSNVGKAADYAATSIESWTRSSQAAGHFDHVVVDPPRSGLATAVRSWIATSRPSSLGYVSCDPVSLARDAGFLVRAGYAVQHARIFDFYPQTSHVETYVRFQLGS